MPTENLSRASYVRYFEDFQLPAVPPQFIGFGNTEVDGHVEQCVFEFAIDPATINLSYPVIFDFKLDFGGVGTKYLRRWVNAYPTTEGQMWAGTALANSTNQITWTESGTSSVSLDVSDLIADMVSASQTTVLLGIPSIADDEINGRINNDDDPPILTHGPPASPIEGTASLDIADILLLDSEGEVWVQGESSLDLTDITLEAEGFHNPSGEAALDLADIVLTSTGRTDTIPGIASLDVIDITLTAVGDSDVANDAHLVLDVITLESTGRSVVRGNLSSADPTKIIITLDADGDVYVKGTLSQEIIVGLMSNNRTTEGTATLLLDDILVSGETPQGGEPRQGTSSSLITVSLKAVAKPAVIGELTEQVITITLYARIQEPAPIDTDSPFLDSISPIFIGPRNATFRSLP